MKKRKRYQKEGITASEETVIPGKSRKPIGTPYCKYSRDQFMRYKKKLKNGETKVIVRLIEPARHGLRKSDVVKSGVGLCLDCLPGGFE